MTPFKFDPPTGATPPRQIGERRELIRDNLHHAFELPDNGSFADLLDAISVSDEARRR